MTGRWRERWQRLRQFIRRPPAHDQLDAEFAVHIALATDDGTARGLSPDEARRRALAPFGSLLPQRTQEIGVRLAVGATPWDILVMVLRQRLAPAAIGLAAGLLASTGANRLLSGQLVDVAPADPTTLAVVAVALCVAAMAGCLIPARRATRVDPLIALRRD